MVITMQRKLKMCEKILKDFDIGLDADSFRTGRYSKIYLFQRCRIIILLLKKLEAIPNIVNLDYENLNELILDELFYYLIQNSLCWKLEVLSEYPSELKAVENDFSFLLEKDESLSAEAILDKKMIFDELSKIHPLLKTKKFLPMVVEAFNNSDVESDFQMYCLINPSISKLLENGIIKKQFLSPLKSPLLLNPECENVLSEDYQICSWLMGYSSYYSEQYLYMLYMNSLLLVCIYYVELAYMQYTGEEKTQISLNGFKFY